MKQPIASTYGTIFVKFVSRMSFDSHIFVSFCLVGKEYQ